MMKLQLKLVPFFCVISLALAQFPVETKTVIVSVRDLSLGLTVSQILDEVERSNFLDRSQRLNNVQERLEKWTTQSQSDLLDFLHKKKSNGHSQIQVESLWITNKIIVRKADPTLIAALQSRRDVFSVQNDPVFPLDDPIDCRDYNYNVNLTNVNQNTVQWGVAKIKADQVWESGTRGRGIVVAIIDTGVRRTHEALKSNFRSSFGWYDPEKRSSRPNDPLGHGTHVTGTIVGTTNGIGVAPEARWIACIGCTKEGCLGSNLIQCGQWVACPTDPLGQDKNCSKAPHVVSNSWGAPGNQDFYDDVIKTWHAGGIIPIFASGNTGPNCYTLRSPGDSLQVISVGATDHVDKLTSFSSVGPSKRGRTFKPDLCAPGCQIISSSNTTDVNYESQSGTSMACPHVSGVVVLMLSKNKKLTYSQIKSALTSSCERVQLGNADQRNCGRVSDKKTPNNLFGYGRINALQAVSHTHN